MERNGDLTIVLPDDPKQTAEAVSAEIETASGKVNFSIALGDITEVKVDAIVCPANPGLEYAGFGGVQVAIAEKAGMATFEEAEKKAKLAIQAGLGVQHSSTTEFQGVPLGFATVTTPGKLKNTKSIIHVNNMRSEEGLPPCDPEVIRLCVNSVLGEADNNGLTSVAFPALGTGIWGVSLPDSLKGTILGMRDFFENNRNSKIKKIVYVVYAQPSLKNASEMKGILATEVFPFLK